MGEEVAEKKGQYSQCHRLLGNHLGDRPVRQTHQLHNRDLFDLLQGHRVNDERDDDGGNADQNDGEHPDLLFGGLDDVFGQHVALLLGGIDAQMLPTSDRLGHRIRITSGLEGGHDGVDQVIVGIDLEPPGPIVADPGVGVKKLQLLSILEANEYRGFAPGGDGAFGDADDGVDVASQMDFVTEFEAQFFGDDDLVVALFQGAAGNESIGIDGGNVSVGIIAHAVDPLHHSIRRAHLQVEKGKRRGLVDVWIGPQRVFQVFVDPGTFGEGPQGILLHHPQIGSDIV